MYVFDSARLIMKIRKRTKLENQMHLGQKNDASLRLEKTCSKTIEPPDWKASYDAICRMRTMAVWSLQRVDFKFLSRSC
jgi:hypothetical protein